MDVYETGRESLILKVVARVSQASGDRVMNRREAGPICGSQDVHLTATCEA